LSEKRERQLQSKIISAGAAARGILFVVSSPSGGGKGTLISRVLNTVPDLGYSVSFTTRTPRNGEVEGRDYFFVSPEKFEAMVAANEFLEWARVHGNLYGTSRSQVSSEISAGRDIMLEVDVQGAASVRELIPDSVSVFILPPSYEALRQRLIARGTDTQEGLELRLRHAPEELKQYAAFDYLIVNEQAEHAAFELASIIYAERARAERQEKRVNSILESFSLTQ
jgi:guanylate kinase